MTKQSIISMMREAQAKGLKTFSTGKPCAQGHISDRYASKGYKCIECADLKDLKSGKKNQLRKGNLQLQIDGTYIGWPCKVCGCIKRNSFKKCIDCVKRRYENNLSKSAEYERARRASNPEKFKLQSKERYRRDNSQKILDGTVRRAKKKNAIPSWVDLPHKRRMREMYKNCPKGFELEPAEVNQRQQSGNLRRCPAIFLVQSCQFTGIECHHIGIHATRCAIPPSP